MARYWSSNIPLCLKGWETGTGGVVRARGLCSTCDMSWTAARMPMHMVAMCGYALRCCCPA
jgi:hypothetical protein